MAGAEVELSVVFNQSAPASALPMNSAVAQTLVDAANDSNASNVTFVASSVLLVSGPVPATTTATPETAVTTNAATSSSAPETAVTTSAAATIAATTTAPVTTTTAPTTTTTAPTTTTTPDAVTYVVAASLLNEVFTDDLLSTSSPRFIQLSQRVSARCNQIYRARFGSDFDRCIVRQFRAAQAQQTRMAGTEVELSVVFNQSAPASALPMNSAVAQTLVDAANDSNASNVTFVASSVLLISGPGTATTTATPETAVTTNAATSSAPETAVTTSAAATIAATTTAPVTTTTAPVTTTTAPTTTTTAPTTTTTTPDAVTYVVAASLLNEVFTDDLLSTSSPRFIQLSQRVSARCNQIYRARFGSDFDRCIVRQFSSSPVTERRWTFSFFKLLRHFLCRFWFSWQ
ncbi:uncharacterized protein AB9X84_017314 [Acanthopagrus schlegelii]